MNVQKSSVYVAERKFLSHPSSVLKNENQRVKKCSKTIIVYGEYKKEAERERMREEGGREKG